MSKQEKAKCCPGCGADHIKKASLVYAQGVGLSAGALAGSSGINAGIGVNASGLALKAAPPKRGGSFKNFFWLLVIWGNGFVFGPKWLGLSADTSFPAWWFFGGILTMIAVVAANRSEAKTAHAAALAEYDKVYMCLRCGTFYKPFEDQTGSRTV